MPRESSSSTIACLALAVFAGCGPTRTDEAGVDLNRTRVEMPFDSYDFQRTAYDPDALRYLMGNAEMGGLADLRGLGFAQLWFTDVWNTAEARRPIQGPLLTRSDDTGEPSHFDQRLSLRDGILKTSVRCSDDSGYETESFFSRDNKHLLALRVESVSTESSTWTLALPPRDFEIENEGVVWSGRDDVAFSKLSWALTVHGVDVVRRDDATLEFRLGAGGEATILYALTTHFDGQDYAARAVDAVTGETSFEELRRRSRDASASTWDQMGSVILPAGDYAKWFYRSLYFLVTTAGADHFLPGELQFSIPKHWDMHAFTYGHAGWSTLAFATMGHRDNAYRMAKWHYQPEALSTNVERIFPEQGVVALSYRGRERGQHRYLEERSPDAIAFGHELTAFGKNVTYPSDEHWDWQRGLDGFAAAMYHTISTYYPDPDFETRYTYPVLKGTAELWRSLLVWDDAEQMFYLPPLLSLSENIMEVSVLDAVLSAKWNLNAAADMAARLDRDPELREQWADAAEKLRVPENGDVYLEYLGDDGTREGGGYFGIRAAACLGYPTIEQIQSIDRDKARRTLDDVWARNDHGEGMITFIMNWFALTEAYLGYGDKAFEISEMSTEVVDPSDATLGEAFQTNEAGEVYLKQPYFLTGYSSFVLVPVSMMLQSYNDEIRLFPAMPNAWKDVVFYDLPAEGGLRVSAQWKDGRPSWVRFTKDSELVLDSDDVSSTVFKYEELIR